MARLIPRDGGMTSEDEMAPDVDETGRVCTDVMEGGEAEVKESRREGEVIE